MSSLWGSVKHKRCSFFFHIFFLFTLSAVEFCLVSHFKLRSLNLDSCLYYTSEAQCPDYWTESFSAGVGDNRSEPCTCAFSISISIEVYVCVLHQCKIWQACNYLPKKAIIIIRGYYQRTPLTLVRVSGESVFAFCFCTIYNSPHSVSLCPFLPHSWTVMICGHVVRWLEMTDDLSEWVIQSEPWGTGKRQSERGREE